MILQEYLVTPPRSVTQGAFLKSYLHAPTGISCRHVKLHLTDKRKCRIFQLLATAKNNSVKPFLM